MVEDDTPRPTAVVLLSGGIDSATTLGVAMRDGFSCCCLTFDYGQRHRAELDAARRIVAHVGAIEHRIVRLDLREFGGSALTEDVAVPKGGAIGRQIPVTYVPARNLVMLSVAVACAEAIGAGDVFTGANAIDYSGYPDCRPEFIGSFERTAALGTRAGVEGRAIRVRAPLIDRTKAEIIRLATVLGLDLSLTHSCYDPDQAGRACGACDACRIRRDGFAAAGVPDPTVYASTTPPG
jgi:7-cyano-7-deazaguanine synthase